MKLQKLCYYSQAWTLVWDEKPLFDEDFQAWANGPANPQLFAKHKGRFVVDKGFLHNCTDEDALSSEQKQNIDIVLEFYGDKDPHWLSELTHMERPWKDARGNCQIGDNCSNVIEKEAMFQYYDNL